MTSNRADQLAIRLGNLRTPSNRTPTAYQLMCPPLGTRLILPKHSGVHDKSSGLLNLQSYEWKSHARCAGHQNPRSADHVPKDPAARSNDFSSNHNGSPLSVLDDGLVHFLSSSIDHVVYVGLVTGSKGEIGSEF